MATLKQLRDECDQLKKLVTQAGMDDPYCEPLRGQLMTMIQRLGANAGQQIGRTFGKIERRKALMEEQGMVELKPKPKRKVPPPTIETGEPVDLEALSLEDEALGKPESKID